jgi:hypothetical protein
LKTKDQIIEELSRLIRELLWVGTDKYQEVMNLFCQIEILPKDEIVDRVVSLPTIDRAKVIEMKKHRSVNTEKLCPRCKTNFRFVLKSGKLTSYCSSCNSGRVQKYRGLQKKSVAIIEAHETREIS